jgi:hypothetical protein
VTRRLLLAALFAIASPAAAKPCLGARADGWDDPITLDALRACQQKERQAFIDKATARTGHAPDERRLDAFDDKQRAEATKYLSRHTIDGGSEPPEEAPAKRPARPAEAGAGAGDIDALKASMVEKSDGGKKGVTPEMASDMKRFLLEKQGSVSPDMQALLDATAKDGPNLTTETMKKLRAAGKEAKGQGLELGIDPKVERALLEDDLEPAPGAPKPGEPGTD